MCYLAVLIYPFTLLTQCLKEQFLLIAKFTLHTVHTAVQVEHGYNYVIFQSDISLNTIVTIEHWFSLILYACMYVCMPVCINVCTVHMYPWMYLHVYVRTYACMCGYACTYVCICVRMYMCMCECEHVCILSNPTTAFNKCQTSEFHVLCICIRKHVHV